MSVGELIFVVRRGLNMAGDDGRQLRREGAAALAGATIEKHHIETIYEADGGVELLCALAEPKNEDETRSDALSALVNLTAWANERGELWEDKTIKVLIDAGGLAAAAQAAIGDGHPAIKVTALMLLQNVTRVAAGADALAALADVTRRLLLAFARRAHDVDDDDWGVEFSRCLRNLTANSSEFRKVVLRRTTGVLAALLPQLVSKCHVERRRGVADALHNCVLAEKDEFFFLLEELHVAEFILFALIQGSDVAASDEASKSALQLPSGAVWANERLPAELKAVVELNEPKLRESDFAVTHSLLETLLCFCSTRRGRQKLNSLSTYSIIRDTDYSFAGETAPVPGAAPASVMVTVDEHADEEPVDEESEKISAVCGELAGMLNRDEVSATTTAAANDADALGVGALDLDDDALDTPPPPAPVETPPLSAPRPRPAAPSKTPSGEKALPDDSADAVEDQYDDPD
ncbi:hypothetical protein M885DRAFT_510276 [Pelagophyceae sp. CCMP2097]|nr:hypothetical protein M885DRAFT_510276 [Pelagophyceae sp. CCMP2097]